MWNYVSVRSVDQTYIQCVIVLTLRYTYVSFTRWVRRQENNTPTQPHNQPPTQRRLPTLCAIVLVFAMKCIWCLYVAWKQKWNPPYLVQKRLVNKTSYIKTQTHLNTTRTVARHSSCLTMSHWHWLAHEFLHSRPDLFGCGVQFGCIFDEVHICVSRNWCVQVRRRNHRKSPAA